MLQLEMICKRYPRRVAARGWLQGSHPASRAGEDGEPEVIEALRETTLNIEQGEFVAIIGPSGSGKTTLLSILGGMLTPTSGRMLLQGESLYELGVSERARIRNERIGFVFQQFNLVPWLSAIENVQLPLCLFGSEAHVQRARAEVLLERFGLSSRLQHHPAELSAGQQQRVALARTLIMDPPLILADEPTGNLDPDSRQIVLEALCEFHDEGRTIVLVTHDAMAARSAHRLLRIVDGQVSEVDRGEIAGAA